MECIIAILEESPESKESGLAYLCEFIEASSSSSFTLSYSFRERPVVCGTHVRVRQWPRGYFRSEPLIGGESVAALPRVNRLFAPIN